jgi:uncharacterized coiled-coil protein SlyX
MSEFYRVLVEKSKIYKSIVNTLLLDLSRAHNVDMEESEARATLLFNANTRQESALLTMSKRIAELEAQVVDYKEDLIEALQDVINYAPPCTSSIEYAEKRLKELTEPIK